MNDYFFNASDQRILFGYYYFRLDFLTPGHYENKYVNESKL